MAASKRELVSPRGDKRFIRRDDKGRITESEDVGRSLTQDRQRRAKSASTPGQGDKGDRGRNAAGSTGNGSTRKQAGATGSTSTAKRGAAKSATSRGAAKSTAKRGASKTTSKATSKATSKRGGSKSTASRGASKSTAKRGASKSATSRGASKSTGARGGATKKAGSATKKAAKSSASRSGTARARGDAKAAATDAIRLLKADHATVRELLAELEATTSRGTRTREELLARVQREIEVHSAIEEEIFYPAFKAAGKRQDDDKLFFEALEEHRAAGELVLPDLVATDLGSECFGGRAKVLKELIEHHAREEEREMFPRARELLDRSELAALGERMAARKRELMAQPASPKSATGKFLSAVVGAFGTSAPDGELAGDGDGAERARADGGQPAARGSSDGSRATRDASS